MPRYTIDVPKDSKLHKRLVSRVSSRIRLGEKNRTDLHERWRRAEDMTLGYVPATEVDNIREGERTRGNPAYTTIMLPYTYALLMSAHTYWTSVFFARSPVHQFSGLHGEAEQQVQAVEALMAYQCEVGGWLGPYYIWLYDTGKYGFGVLGQYWCEEKIHYGELVEMQDPATGQMGIYQLTHEIEGYKGNKVFNVSPWDFLTDPRFPIGRFQDGEFCARRLRLGWHDIIKRQDAGYFNKAAVEKLEKHISDTANNEGGSQLKRPALEGFNLEDEDIEGKKITHPAAANFWEFYIELIPNEWGLGPSNYPQKWCITITEDLGLIMGATPMGLIHSKFPFDILESEVEGYGIANRGIPEIMEPIQNTMDWLINTHFYNVRATLNNQFILDPSKIVAKDAERGGPGFIWRLRPEAYGEDIRKFFMQVPVTDVTRSNMQDIQGMLQIGERTLGINDQIMGAMMGGGRKTATEVRTSTGFGVNRLKTTTEYMSATGFSEHSRKLLQTSQQKFDMEGKLRIVGDLAQGAGPAFLNIDPKIIQGSFGLVPVDGTLPVDRMAQANLWKELMGTLFRTPQLAQGFDIPKLMSWVFTLVGPKNINQFRIKVVPDDMAQQQAQQGNIIPMPRGQARLPAPVTPGNAASTQAGLEALAPPAE